MMDSLLHVVKIILWFLAAGYAGLIGFMALCLWMEDR